MKKLVYDVSILPVGFEFPADYLDAALADDFLDLEPWRLLSEDMATSLFYYGAMLLKFPGAALVPFAIVQDESGRFNDGWVVIACFDGGDKDGNSSVRIYDYSKPKLSPWDNLAYSGFSEWLIATKAESSRYKTEKF